MSASTVLEGLHAAGVTLRLKDGVLHAGPRHAVTEAVSATIRAHKTELVAVLAFIADMLQQFPGAEVIQ